MAHLWQLFVWPWFQPNAVSRCVSAASALMWQSLSHIPKGSQRGRGGKQVVQGPAQSPHPAGLMELGEELRTPESLLRLPPTQLRADPLIGSAPPMLLPAKQAATPTTLGRPTQPLGLPARLTARLTGTWDQIPREAAEEDPISPCVEGTWGCQRTPEAPAHHPQHLRVVYKQPNKVVTQPKFLNKSVY